MFSTEMFKKKPNIPPRPSPPGISQLLADLDNSDCDDIVFQRNKLALENLLNEIENSEEDSGAGDDENDPEKLYLRVKNFVETNNILHEYVKTLEQQNDNLQICDAELKRIAEEIRKQAQQALK
ncbi:UPF0449 protein C19orf25 homolog [Schistocerca serialis cubense]|uniref:UPF0449 protein C19orf25 homolog n=1 Tax=Schistocerca serialis cubense TaxID=2023355 RepID=UPI00214E8A8A|nr:UPF0449 protein C19orf25 homolog [Schistocerca serialis cubense]